MIDTQLIPHATANPWKPASDRWKTFLVENRAPTTAKDYTGYVKKFLGNLNDPISIPTDTQFNRYVNTQGVSLATRSMRRAALFSFFKWLCNAGLLTFNPMANIQSQWRDLPHSLSLPNPDEPFTHDEIYRLLTSDKVTPTFRWMIALGYFLGLRLNEVALLQWGAWGESTLQLRQRKTGEVISLPYDHPCLGTGIIRDFYAEMLDHWLLRNGHTPSSEGRPYVDEPCFPHLFERYGRMNGMNHTFVAFKKMCEEHGVQDKGTHSLRRACAQRCHDAGLNLDEIGTILGHSRSATTQRYIHTPINRSEVHGYRK